MKPQCDTRAQIGPRGRGQTSRIASSGVSRAFHASWYEASEPGAPDAVHWIGFDCAHAFDLYPAISLVLGKLLSRHHGRYRDKDEVRHLVTALALELKVLQLAAAGS
jgi:hypothetical protein